MSYCANKVSQSVSQQNRVVVSERYTTCPCSYCKTFMPASHERSTRLCYEPALLQDCKYIQLSFFFCTVLVPVVRLGRFVQSVKVRYCHVLQFCSLMSCRHRVTIFSAPKLVRHTHCSSTMA